MPKLTDAQASFLHDEAHYAVIAALREDGSVHQTVIWIDWDAERELLLLNLNNFRAKLDYLEQDPRVSVLVIANDSAYRWIGLEGKVAEITTEGAYEHIVRQAKLYLGRDGYELGEGEERVLVKVALERVEAHGV